MAVALRKALPANSILHNYLDAQSIVETPVGYDLVCGASIIGAVLRRDLWYDQIEWKVYPNISILLVGSSGTGKDTAINKAATVLEATGRIPRLNTLTIEGISAELVRAADRSGDNTAAAILVAQEIADLFGPKDYQAGILTGLTKILSSGEVVNIGLKGDMEKKIHRPTVTIFGGSTINWLHEYMPKSTNSGGFYPRLIIIVESVPKRTDAALLDWLPADEVRFATEAMEKFLGGYRDIIQNYQRFGRIQWATRTDAEVYIDWYGRRKKQFSVIADAYAHRSRDNCLRLCILSAISCGRKEMIAEDGHFGEAVINYVAERIDSVFAPPTTEAAISGHILKMLPALKGTIWTELSKFYKPSDIQRTTTFLVDSGQVVQIQVGSNFELRKKES